MEQSEYLRRLMPTFMNRDIKGRVISFEKKEAKEVISDWSKLLISQADKKLVPLFITGSGVSFPDVPSVNQIIEQLHKSYGASDVTDSQLESYFERWSTLYSENKKDRALVANILNAFQNPDSEQIEVIWDTLNKKLLSDILYADPTKFHKGLAKLYQDFHAMCMTLNFDGLLIRELINTDKKAFSLPTKKELEAFFLRSISQGSNELVEIQIRGDILYLECKTKGFCTQKGKDAIPLWSSITIAELKEMRDIGKDQINAIIERAIKCPACSRERKSYLSFPGSYEKERDMKDILEVVWKYLSFKIGSVTIVGMSGEWDPLIIAFLGDLLSERNIPLLIIDKNADTEKTYVIRELVTPKTHNAVALKASADDFMTHLLDAIDQNKVKSTASSIEFTADGFDDELIFPRFHGHSI